MNGANLDHLSDVQFKRATGYTRLEAQRYGKYGTLEVESETLPPDMDAHETWMWTVCCAAAELAEVTPHQVRYAEVRGNLGVGSDGDRINRARRAAVLAIGKGGYDREEIAKFFHRTPNAIKAIRGGSSGATWDFAADVWEAVQDGGVPVVSPRPDLGVIEPALIDKPVLHSNVRGLWQKQEDETLETMLRDGKTQPEIAKVLGRSQRSVEWRIEKLGFSGRFAKPGRRPYAAQPWDDQQDSILLEMRAKGHPFTDIGRELDRSHQSCAHRYRLLSQRNSE